MKCGRDPDPKRATTSVSIVDVARLERKFGRRGLCECGHGVQGLGFGGSAVIKRASKTLPKAASSDMDANFSAIVRCERKFSRRGLCECGHGVRAWTRGSSSNLT